MTTENAAEAVPSPDTQADTTEAIEGAAAEQPEGEAEAEKPETMEDKLSKLEKAHAKQVKRYAKKDAAYHEQVRLNENLLKQLQEAKPSTTAQPTTAQTKAAKALSPDDFDTVPEYLEAVAARVNTDQFLKIVEDKFKELEGKLKTDGDAAKAESAQAVQTAKQQAAYNHKAEEVAKAIPDYHKVVQENFNTPVSPHVMDAIYDADNGPLVAYYALKEDLFDDLNAMTPAKAAMEIARIEIKAQSLLDKSKPASKAPKPMQSTGGTATAGTKQPHQMSPSELVAWLKT